jgi:hypothetical protein
MDVFLLPELTDIIMCYGETEEKLSVSTNSGFLAEIIHTTQCLLYFINAV